MYKLNESLNYGNYICFHSVCLLQFVISFKIQPINNIYALITTEWFISTNNFITSTMNWTINSLNKSTKCDKHIYSQLIAHITLKVPLSVHLTISIPVHCRLNSRPRVDPIVGNFFLRNCVFHPNFSASLIPIKYLIFVICVLPFIYLWVKCYRATKSLYSVGTQSLFMVNLQSVNGFPIGAH